MNFGFNYTATQVRIMTRNILKGSIQFIYILYLYIIYTYIYIHEILSNQSFKESF